MNLLSNLRDTRHSILPCRSIKRARPSRREVLPFGLELPGCVAEESTALLARSYRAWTSGTLK